MDSSRDKQHRKVASDRVSSTVRRSIPRSDVEDVEQEIKIAILRKKVDPARGTQGTLEAGITKVAVLDHLRKLAKRRKRERQIEGDVPGPRQTGMEGLNDEVASVLGMALDCAYSRCEAPARAVILLTVAGEAQEYIGHRMGVPANTVRQAVFKFRRRYLDQVKAVDPGVFKTFDDSGDIDINRAKVDIGEAYAARVALMEHEGGFGLGYFPNDHAGDWVAARGASEVARAADHGRGLPPPRRPSADAIDGDLVIKYISEAAAVVQGDAKVPLVVRDVYLDRLGVIAEIIEAGIKEDDGLQLQLKARLSTALLLVRRPFPLYPSYYPLAVLAAFAGIEWADD